MALDFDSSRSWERLEQRLAETDNPRHRKMLETVIAHTKAEAHGDIDGVMATLGPDPKYHFWRNGKDFGPKGYGDIRKFYDDLLAKKATVLESNKERITVDDHTIVHEGTIRTILPGSVVRERGGQVEDEDTTYIVTTRTLISWPFDEEGRPIGEDSYSSMDLDSIEVVPEQDWPEQYRSLVGRPPVT